jgi:membrane-associated protease RseP (regulator of RpoE activity)
MLRNPWKVLPVIAIIGINAHFIPAMHRLGRNAEARVSQAVQKNLHLSCPSTKTLATTLAQPEVASRIADDGLSAFPAMPGMELAGWTPQSGQTQEAPTMPPMPDMPSVNERDIRAQVQNALTQVRDLGDDDTGWLGVAADEVTADRAKDARLSSERGVYVASVEAGSPAEKAGLKKGDVIVSYGGENVEGTRQFRRLVLETPPGRTISLAVWRDGASHQLSVRVGQRDKEESFAFPDMHGDHGPLPRDFKFHFDMPSVWDFGAPRLGISAQDLNGQLGAYFGAPDGKGVLITEVLPDTAAEEAGLKAGDVITRVGGKAIDSTADLRENLRSKSASGEITVSILRRGSAMTVRVKLPKPAAPEGPEIIQRVEL